MKGGSGCWTFILISCFGASKHLPLSVIVFSV